MLYFIALALFAYLVGSINPAFIIGEKLKGVDLRTVGSGNPGVSNTFRTLGKGPATIVGCFDVAKGLLPVLAGRLLGLETYQYIFVGLAAVIGHSWPVFYGFSGGRGMATSFGAIFIIAPLPLIIFLVTLGVSLYLFKSAGLTMLINFLFMPLWAFLLGEEQTVIIGILSFLWLTIFRRILGSRYKSNLMVTRGQKLHQPPWQTVSYRICFDRDTRHADGLH
ncbi:MAG: glycerol-3-phosphate acyltransferase [Dehalococcoidia bacterium]|nr:glycerol-3-phosphate acyltransferase [Dehalococcoidia bacterium]